MEIQMEMEIPIGLSAAPQVVKVSTHSSHGDDEFCHEHATECVISQI